MAPRTLMIVLALCAVSLNAQAERVYKWVDENGTVHYSQQPPPGHESTEMEVRDGHTAEGPFREENAPAVG